MKRLTACILALCLLALCGCGAAQALDLFTPKAELTTPAPTETPVEAPELAPILTEIRERMHPGTAGSSLTAAQLACALLDWSCLTGMDEAQISAAAEDFLAPMTERERTEFALQMMSVHGAVGTLLSEDGAGLLDDIGGPEGTLWPWDSAQQDKLDAVFSAFPSADPEDW